MENAILLSNGDANSIKHGRFPLYDKHTKHHLIASQRVLVDNNNYITTHDVASSSHPSAYKKTKGN